MWLSSSGLPVDRVDRASLTALVLAEEKPRSLLTSVLPKATAVLVIVLVLDDCIGTRTV